MSPETTTETTVQDPSTTPEITEGAAALNQALSDRLGVNVYSRDAQWLQYSQAGVVVEVHLARERFKLQLTLELLGIAPENEKEAKALNQLLAPGHRYLLPARIAKKGDSIDSQARENLKRYGRKTFWGQWIHVAVFPAWKAQNDRIEAEYLAWVDSIEAQYDELVEENTVAFIGLCNGTWERLRPLAASSRIPNFDDKEVWVREQVQRMLAEVPSMERIRRKLKYSYDVTSLPSLAAVEADRVRARDIRLTEAERIMMAEIERTQARRVAGGVEQFMAEIRGQLQSQVFDTIAVALQVARGNGGRLKRNNVVALRDLIGSVKELDFWGEGNGSLQSRLADLQGILDIPGWARSADEVEQILQTLGAEARLTLMELDQPISRKAALIADAVGLGGDVEQLEGLVRRGSPWDADDLTGGGDDLEATAVRQAPLIQDDDFGDPDLVLADQATRQAVGSPA